MGGGIKGETMAEPKNKVEKNRRLKQAYVVIALVSIAYFTDRFIGIYTGDWKVYAIIVAAIYAVGAGYLTVTDIIDRLMLRIKHLGGK